MGRAAEPPLPPQHHSSLLSWPEPGSEPTAWGWPCCVRGPKLGSPIRAPHQGGHAPEPLPAPWRLCKSNSSGRQPGVFASVATICLSFTQAGPALAAEGDSPGAMRGLCVGTAPPRGLRVAPPPAPAARSRTRLRAPQIPPGAPRWVPRPRGPGSYRKANAHGGGEGAWDELALVKLDQQRRLPHAAVSNQDGLQGARQA